MPSSSSSILVLLLSFFLANNHHLSSHGLYIPRAIQSRVQPSSFEKFSLSATPIEEESSGDIKSILGISDAKSGNLDYVRRARSLVRRDRLAQWRAAVTHVEDEVRNNEDNYFLAAAFLPAILAFVLWGKISLFISGLIYEIGAVNSPEGKLFADNLLRPTIIGVVVPVIGITLATLVSTTVNVLRQRQVDLRAFINEEAGELRFLRRAIFG